jgi:hypothetical protein
MNEGRNETTAADELAPWVDIQPDGTQVLRLEQPVVLGALRVERLFIAPIRAKHMRAMKTTDTSGMLDLLEALTKETRAVIDELGVRDTTRALEIVGRGFGDGPATGAG